MKHCETKTPSNRRQYPLFQFNNWNESSFEKNFLIKKCMEGVQREFYIKFW
jgi:hypothetical protein